MEIKVTKSYAIFFQNYLSLMQLVNFMVYLVKRTQFTINTAKNALGKIDRIMKGSDNPNDTQNDKSQDETVVIEFKKNVQLLFEILLCRVVEHYQYYIVSILKEVFKQKPDILKSSNTVKVEDVLSYDSMEAFIDAQIEKQITELSYASFENMNKFFHKKLGVSLVSESDKRNIITAIEIRNISVHNNCIINNRFLQRTRTTDCASGQKRTVTFEELSSLFDSIEKSIKELDAKLIDKFELHSHTLDFDEHNLSHENILDSSLLK